MADSFLRVETAESCIVLAILLMPLNALSRLPLFTWASTTLENKALTALESKSFLSGGLDVILTCAVANDPKESCTTTHSVSILFVPEPAGMIAVFSGLLDEGPQTLQSLPVPLLSAPKAYLRGKASFSAIHPVAAIKMTFYSCLICKCANIEFGAWGTLEVNENVNRKPFSVLYTHNKLWKYICIY